MTMHKTIRIALLAAIPLVFTACFNIIHHIDRAKDGTVQVRWRMSVSSALAEMGQMQQADPEAESFEDNMAEAKAKIEESLKGLAKTLKVQNFTNEQHQGIDVALTLKDVKAMQRNPQQVEEMPIVPFYDAKKDELIFRFTPENTAQLQGAEEEDEAEETNEAEDAGESGDAMSADDEDDSEEEMADDESEGAGGLDALGEKLGQLFASAASYDIILGSGFAVDRAFVRDSNGQPGQAIEVLRLGDVNMVRFPLLGMIGSDEGEEGFEIVVKLKK